MNNQNQEIYVVQIFDKDEIGLHARPASAICQITNKKIYKDNNDVKIVKLDDDTDLNNKITLNKKIEKKLQEKKTIANGHSILSVMSLAVKHKNKIAFIVTGPNNKEIIDEIQLLLEKEKLI